MGKKDLIGGSLWEQYSNQVIDRMNDPKFRGSLTEVDAAKIGGKLVVADWGAESCGDSVRLYWIVDKDNKIVQAKFKSFGCGTAIASSDAMCELCIGKTVEEAVKITNIDVEKFLRDEPDVPAVPPQKMHCSVMAYDVIKKAAAIHSGKSKEDFEDDEMVCECARVTLSTIKEVIKINDLKSVEEITAFTKAGAFCKSCVRPGGHEKKKYYLVDILRDTRREMEIEKGFNSEVKFKDMTVVQKLKTIEKIMDEKIRPMLVKDGGGAEIVDIKDGEDSIEVFVHYTGACSRCAGSSGTIIFIEEELRKNLDEKINVYSVEFL